MNHGAKLFTLGALFLALTLPIPSRADTIYSNLGPGSSYDCCDAWGVGFGHVTQAMPFFVPAGPAYDLTQIDIALTWNFGTNAVPVKLMNDSGGLPGSSVLGQWTFTNLPAINSVNTIQSAQSASISGTTLSGGTQYWLAATHELPFTGAWNKNNTSQSGVVASFSTIDNLWHSCNDCTLGAFAVYGNPVDAQVPEPTTMLLLGSGLLGVAGYGKRKLFKKG